mgnify:CR=1 FL=1
MGFFGVDSWEEVISVFDKGGQLEGKWGWLEILRNAKEGDEVRFISESGTLDPFEDSSLAGGIISIKDGKLVITSANGDTLHIFEAKNAQAYAIKHFATEKSTVYTGQVIPAGQKFSHLKVEDWNNLYDPLEWEHLVTFNVAPAIPAGLGFVSISGGIALCSGGPSCVLGGLAIANGVVFEGAAVGLLYSAYLFDKKYFEETFEITP